MAIFDIKDTTIKDVKRLIVSMDTDELNTIGFKVSKIDLYQLYTLLKEMFKDE